MLERPTSLAGVGSVVALALACGCRIEPVPARGADADAPVPQREENTGVSSDTVVVLLAPDLDDAGVRALAWCRALQGGSPVDGVLGTAVRELEFVARARGLQPREILLAGSDGRWGAAAAPAPSFAGVTLASAALSMWAHGSGLRIIDALATPTPGDDAPALPGGGPVAPVEAPADATDEDAGVEPAPAGQEPTADSFSVAPPPIGLLLRVSRVELRGALIAFEADAELGALRAAVPGERLYVGPRGGVLRTAPVLRAAAAANDYAVLNRPLSGPLPADALFVTPQGWVGPGDWVVARASAGLRSECVLVTPEAGP